MAEPLKIEVIISSLRFIGEVLSDGDYVSASEMTHYGKQLIDIAERLEEDVKRD